jgi:citrate synthase
MLNSWRPDSFAAKVFDATLIIYAEHGYNASAFSARVTASTLSDMYSAVVSAIGTLKGPLHGGANEEAMAMMLEIGDPAKAEQWVLDSLAQKKRIMGFGHRVYKKGDSRVPVLSRLGKALSERVGEMKWYEMATTVEQVMMREKGLHPNVDFPAAYVYYLLGIPIPLYTPIFALSRITGWSAHIIEQLDDNRLIRPSCHYTGAIDLEYLPIDRRG